MSTTLSKNWTTSRKLQLWNLHNFLLCLVVAQKRACRQPCLRLNHLHGFLRGRRHDENLHDLWHWHTTICSTKTRTSGIFSTASMVCGTGTPRAAATAEHPQFPASRTPRARRRTAPPTAAVFGSFLFLLFFFLFTEEEEELTQRRHASLSAVLTGEPTRMRATRERTSASCSTISGKEHRETARPADCRQAAPQCAAAPAPAVQTRRADGLAGSPWRQAHHPRPSDSTRCLQPGEGDASGSSPQSSTRNPPPRP